MLSKEHRLTRRSDFQLLSRKGRSWANRLLILKAKPNSLLVSRYGFSVSKAIGNAVARNRTKRQLREIVRKRNLKPGWDVLIIARAAIVGSRFNDIERAVEQLMVQACLLESEHEKASA
ncbi:MAG: ribonuclease P protein component [Dehalococcoidia bacterium]|nr:ribonuclease P protein component [Dehalococcoidia bacterium]